MTAHEASSSSSSKSKLWNYNVFLSFSGEDTRKGFTGHLHAALKDKGYRVFIDEDDLERGEKIKEKLFLAIEESRISIIVFSKRYANSSWCLDELVKIMECRSKLGRRVLPIFYHVNPSHVRKQDGDLAKAFQKHENRIGAEKDDKKREAKQERVKQWREALTEAANLSGHPIQITDNGHEATLVREIVDKITTEWLPRVKKLNVAKYPIGINSRVRDIISYLSGGGSNDVVMVGIWGMGGLGKTTVAKAIYNQIHHKFEFKSFLADVSNTTSKHGLVYLQEKLISEVLKQKFQISNVDEGINLIEEQFSHRRVLVIVDNIDEVKQLDAIVGDRNWFGPGSRIIITTRDEHLLNQVDKTVMAQKMNEEEALELFSWHAFGYTSPNTGYYELSKQVVSYCGGLPLALEVLGSFLIKRNVAEWRSQLEKLKRTPAGGIIKRLRISFEGLDDTQKAIFLDISCFFIGWDKDYVAKVLDECEFSAAIEISVLRERCLVTVERNELNMHDLLREMARVIISEKSLDHPGNWSRLWNPREVINVLINKSGTEEVEGLSLHLSILDFKSYEFSTEAFTNMKKLRLLQLNNVQLKGKYKHLPKELIWLCWRGFLLQSIPDGFFNQEKLVFLDMQGSQLVQVWEGSKSFQKLKILDLSYSFFLIKSPDVSQLPNLEKLILEGCDKLSEIHPSTGHLGMLSLVNLKGCKMLSSLPKDFYKSKSVKTLCLNHCSKFRELHKNLQYMSSLIILEADYTAIKQVSPSRTDDEIPTNLGKSYYLRDLHLQGNVFHTLPNLSGLSKLQTLMLDGCFNLRAILDLPTNLKFLYAPRCNALETMPNFSKMSNMRELDVRHSTKLTEVPGLDKSSNSMTWIHMQGCANLTSDFRKNILQGWTSCGFGGILLHGNYVPDWFEFVNDGNKVSFDIPPSDDHNFEGLTLFCVYNQQNSNNEYLSLAITVINNTKCTKLRACISLEVFDENRETTLWQGQLSNDKLNLQGGDKVEVEIVIVEPDYSGSLKRIGVHLVWDKPLKENIHNLDRAGYVLSHIQLGSMVRHNESGDASSSSHI
ncbi:disease resistance protein RUN1-like [Pyrus communis]|uniref:disease resistance protein RUN1-like n=1 Tax=Pyrus communis TaxID=23211 RepID=UPI0035C12669